LPQLCPDEPDEEDEPGNGGKIMLSGKGGGV
jgi:hypothetical protein